MAHFIILYYALLFIIIFLCISFFLDFFLEILQLEKKNYPHNTACMPCSNFSVHSKAVSRFQASWRSEVGTSHFSPATQASGLSLGFPLICQAPVSSFVSHSISRPFFLAQKKSPWTGTTKWPLFSK